MPNPFRSYVPRPAEPPIRAELFGAERLDQHAESLAAAQPVKRDHGWARPLLSRVHENADVLRDAYRTLAAAARGGEPVVPAAEWLIENFHVIDEQLREIRDDLPAGFYRELPKLAAGPLLGHPRVYGIAWALVAHTDSRFDPESLRRFVKAYQRVSPLTIGELWAIAITLRIVLVENLRRLADEILTSRALRGAADRLADDLIGMNESDANEAMIALRRLDTRPLERAFTVHLIERLRDQDPATMPALPWLHRRLAAEGTSPDTTVQAELQWQAATTVTARNVITSMRLISAIDWSDFFESVSLVDEVLRAQTGFGAMDFRSRDNYRHAIEDLARRSGHDELDVTRDVIARAQQFVTESGTDVPSPVVDRRADPGFHLIGKGREEFEKSIGYRATPARLALRRFLRMATEGYLGAIFLLTAALLAAPIALALHAGATHLELIILGLLGAFPASDLAVALVNRLVTAVVPPRELPRLELRGGIDPTLRTMVVIPTLLTDLGAIGQMVDRLEAHFLANPEGDVSFALLTDWTDADLPSMPTDAEMLESVRNGIAQLNDRYRRAPGEADRFRLLHRERRWNDRERRWMGWERKRGKLRELNRLLRGATDTSFLPAGTSPVPAGVRYVIVLDADTRMPMGAVCRLVGTMAHPLNRARIDPAVDRVVEGYGVMQPRITPPLSVGESTFFQRVTSGPGGVDPYALAVSDVYQDLFEEGSYTGKGIYDVDAFEATLDARVPENALLSHDLFEGTFARAALVSDIELFEAAPSHYLVAAARQHRWARGDWQLLPWLFRFRVPFISRWKMIDNLRRTFSAPAAFLLLCTAWIIAHTDPLPWTALVLVSIAIPPFLPALSGLIPRKRGASKRSHARAVTRDFVQGASQAGLSIAMLAHQAAMMSDAIGRTLWRLFVSRRHLLDWATAAQVESGQRLDRRHFFRSMAAPMVLAVIAFVLIIQHHFSMIPLAVPFIALWFTSPWLAHEVSVPAPAIAIPELLPSDAVMLRLVARQTWRFFSTFVTAEDHFLPPDNYQESPAPVVAHRTSPTNMGLYLLSTVAANDFGWIGLMETAERLEQTLDSMSQLERLHGHYYNWYATLDRRPLEPRYLSSVDSGNLAGALLTLAGACREMVERPVLDQAVFRGMQDTASLLRRAARAAETPATAGMPPALSEALDVVDDAVTEDPPTPLDWARRFAAIEQAIGLQAAPPDKQDASEVERWTDLLQQDVASHARDIGALAPWVRYALSSPAPGLEEMDAQAPRLIDASSSYHRAAERLLADNPGSGEQHKELDGTVQSLREAAAACDALVLRINAIAERAHALVAAMDFGILFDRVRKLFAIGLRVADSTLDSGLYDLLASEARLTSFVAIAKGDVPVSHWFHLGRALTPVGKDSILISWSGSMFEYLMPSLIMHAPEGSLLDQTCRLMVRHQIDYGTEQGVPWGISESGYNVRDIEMTYQYSTFGVPGLGLRRRVGEDLVIAPYATGLVAMIDPAAAAENFRHLAAAGARGKYGFYEALDYTPSRVPTGAKVAIVRSYMAHHQGMIVLGITDALLNGPMRRRFHAEPYVRASELLLQERTPRDVAVARPQIDDAPIVRDVQEPVAPISRRFLSPHTSVPRTHLLSNGQYTTMLTAAGGGFSQWRDLAITRWREDATCDAAGAYIYLRDVGTGDVWSAGYQPTGASPDSYSVAFSEDRAEFIRHDGPITTRLEVVVSPEDDAEVRRVTLTNDGIRTREIEVTSYAEIVLAPQAADVAHPAFSDLFVQTESAPDRAALLATRRPRSATDEEPWLAHVLAVDGETVGDVQWETDRARFLGRGRGVRMPQAVTSGRPLSNTVGSVLDPVVALRRRVRLRPGARAQLTFSTMVAPTRERILDLADRYHEPAAFERAADLAWTQAQVQLRHLGVTPDEAHLFQTLATAALYSNRSLRPSPAALARANGGRGALWTHGISGDLPIVLVQVDDTDDVGLVRQLLRAHGYWRAKHLAIDLVILNDHGQSYVQDLQLLLETLARASQPATNTQSAPRGSVFVLRADRVLADRDALMTAARAVLSGRRGTLAEQVIRSQRIATSSAPPEPRRIGRINELVTHTPKSRFFNGVGGFSEDGREYVIELTGDRTTPAPWINVICNPQFGFQVSECGSGYTWSINSRENQVTAWSNDPVNDPPSEVLYVRDEETGDVWSPTALPIRNVEHSYTARHGHGYSRFEHDSHAISLDLLQYVPRQDSVKVSRLTVTNRSRRYRRLTVTSFVEWVLGVSRGASAPFIVSELDANTGAMLATNGWNTDFRDRVAFADLGEARTSCTADRTEFIGRNGSLEQPAALQDGGALSGRIGAGLDPCAAQRLSIELPPGGSRTITLLLGEAATREEASALVSRYRAVDHDASLREVVDYWEDVLGTVQVETPEPAMDLMMNRWLLYQTLACRIWARSAFYQASGAYGFRDQLQDVMAVAVASPGQSRAHILRTASRQFVEGDVQHWWHPTTGRGLRTRMSDDLVWLPYVVTHYLNTSQDRAVLDAAVPFLEGPRLGAAELECYFEPRISDEQASLYEHCARAIDRSLTVGRHGLPLIGTGDWNDGMNRVGYQGKGESVWLGWFLCAVLRDWAPLADSREEHERAERWRGHAAALAKAIEATGWDGAWYRRAYFDDGTPLGASSNDECRIDAISQSWSVLSGSGDKSRSRRAMNALDENLVRRKSRLHLLLTPAFDKTALDPGYIKGYLPGIRENGGQYTHAAAWSVFAWAALGDGDRASELFGILNPIMRTQTLDEVARYKVEPYVVAGDVYSEAPHEGRGGWTWYTGAAGWIYRAGLEAILGFHLRGSRLEINPCIPKEWPGFKIVFRYHSARYSIRVENPERVSRGVVQLELDGVAIDARNGISLTDDARVHDARVVLGSAT